MSWLSDRLKPPSSWDSFKKGTLRPVIKTGGTALGALLGGPAGGALGASLGGILGDAAAGENVRKSTTLRSVGGDALTGALAGYAAQAGPLAKLLGRGGSGGAEAAALNLDGVASNAAPGASSVLGAVGGAAKTAGSALKDYAPLLNVGAQAALGYGQARQQQRIADEGLNFLRSNYADREAYRKRALELMNAAAPDTSVLVEDPLFRRTR